MENKLLNEISPKLYLKNKLKPFEDGHFFMSPNEPHFDIRHEKNYTEYKHHGVIYFNDQHIECATWKCRYVEINLNKIQLHHLSLSDINFALPSRCYHYSYTIIGLDGGEFTVYHRGINHYVINMEQSEIIGCDFSGCDLRQVNLRKANLSYCNFTGAILGVASEANFQGACFDRTNLLYANLQKANLSGIDMRTIKYFSYVKTRKCYFFASQLPTADDTEVTQYQDYFSFFSKNLVLSQHPLELIFKKMPKNIEMLKTGEWLRSLSLPELKLLHQYIHSRGNRLKKQTKKDKKIFIKTSNPAMFLPISYKSPLLLDARQLTKKDQKIFDKEKGPNTVKIRLDELLLEFDSAIKQIYRERIAYELSIYSALTRLFQKNQIPLEIIHYIFMLAEVRLDQRDFCQPFINEKSIQHWNKAFKLN